MEKKKVQPRLIGNYSRKIRKNRNSRARVRLSARSCFAQSFNLFLFGFSVTVQFSFRNCWWISLIIMASNTLKTEIVLIYFIYSFKKIIFSLEFYFIFTYLCCCFSNKFPFHLDFEGIFHERPTGKQYSALKMFIIIETLEIFLNKWSVFIAVVWKRSQLTY